METKTSNVLNLKSLVICAVTLLIVMYLSQFLFGGFSKISICTDKIDGPDSCITQEYEAYFGYVPMWLCEALGDTALIERGGFSRTKGYVGCSPD